MPVKFVEVLAAGVGVGIEVFCNAGTIELLCTGAAIGVIFAEPVVAAGFVVLVGAEFNGAPTDISHL